MKLFLPLAFVLAGTSGRRGAPAPDLRRCAGPQTGCRRTRHEDVRAGIAEKRTRVVTYRRTKRRAHSPDTWLTSRVSLQADQLAFDPAHWKTTATLSRGIFVFNVATIAEADALLATDPAVQAGALIGEVYLLYGSAALQQVTALHQRISRE